MIACRPFSGLFYRKCPTQAARLWKLASTAKFFSSTLFHFQGCFSDYTLYVPSMVGARGTQNSLDQEKKRKLGVPMWRPIPMQSGETAAGITVSISSSSGDADDENRPEAIEENQSVSSSCEVEKISGIHVHTTGSAADQLVEVIKGNINDYGSRKDAEVASEVEKHSVQLEVDAPLIRFIKGRGGSTQQLIERETGVTITFPSFKSDNYIVIEGVSTESVTKASEMIATVLEEAIKSPSLDYSHFISLPLAIHPELVERLQKFQNSILGYTSSQDYNLDSGSNEDHSDDHVGEDRKSKDQTVDVKLEVKNENEHVRVKIDTTDANSTPNRHRSSRFSGRGIDKSIFIKPKTFHLTVLMLKLWNKDRVVAATEVLQKISSHVNEALDNQPVSVRLTGLECMRGSPAKARVVYAPVEVIGGESRLLKACQIITDAYIKAGLVLEKDARQKLKLHATLMNVKHRKRSKGPKNRDSFDAREIFVKYGSEQWGEYLIREAHLSQRFKYDESGYYHCCASIPFPESRQAE